MDTVLQLGQQRQTLVTLLGGVVLGLILGLVIGWGLWPVEWTNSTPGNLRWDFQNDYVLWVAKQYAENGDVGWAREKLGVEFWKKGQLAETIEQLAEERGGEETIQLRALAQALEATPAAPEPSLLARLRPLGLVCGVGILVVALVGGALYLISQRQKSQAAREVAERGVGVAERVPPAERVLWGVEGPPLAQFPTTYRLGDDHYDPSFSIELETGEFMGECGVSISETIGVGAPHKVTAFEVWLFDKNDIRTVTKVLMSEYAFHDEALHTKLAPKGEPVLVQEGQDVILDTRTLRVRARIVEAAHGMGDLPPNSFFEKLVIDLASWVKPEEQGETIDA